MILFSTYAPPQTTKHPVNERQQFFNELAQFWMSVSCNRPKIIAGDLNSRLYCRLANEHSFIGNSIVEQIERKLDMSMNRFQLIELCSELELQIHNTFSNMELHDLVTYREICYRTEQCISRSNHELLDLFLVPQVCAWQCQIFPSIKKFCTEEPSLSQMYGCGYREGSSESASR